MQKDEHAAKEAGSVMTTRKRQSNEERRPGRDDDDDAPTETFITTPQLATPEEMAKRRILRVVRPEATATAAASASTSAGSGGASGGFFKFLAAQGTSAPAATPAFPTMQPFGASVTGATADKAAAPRPTTSATPAPFALASMHHADIAKEKTETTRTTPGDAVKPAPLFGAGAFSFGNAVSSFVEARRKMEAAHVKEQAASSDGVSVEPKDKQEGTSGEGGDDEAGQSFGDKPVIAPAAGEVLAVAPCKLYAFDKDGSGGAGKWVERGMGEVKLKKQTVAKENRATATTPATAGTVYRLLVRDGYSLNITLGKDTLLLSKVEAKHLIFNAAGVSGPTTYMLRFTGPEAEANARVFADQLKRYTAGIVTDKS